MNPNQTQDDTVKLTPIKLALFFSRGVSLELWEQTGLLSREVALYQRLQSFGMETVFVTYGGKADQEIATQLPGITALTNRWRLPERVYAHAIPFLHRSELSDCHLFKTNQITGSEVALRSARFWNKPIVARCGYLLSTIMKNEGTEEEFQRVCELENELFTASACGMVTTPQIARTLQDRNPSGTAPLFIQPNYIDTNLFAPDFTAKKNIDLLYIGRLSREKNVAALLAAIRPLTCNLTVIGNGPLKSKLQQEFADLSSRVTWVESVPNAELPAWLKRAKMFVLPSFYEGHPKALLEAMACGLPVIGSDVSGIRELIAHNITGLLSETDETSLRHAITTLASQNSLRDNIGQAARRFVETSFPLEKLAEREYTILQQVAHHETDFSATSARLVSRADCLDADQSAGSSTDFPGRQPRPATATG